jgi:NTE family protein
VAEIETALRASSRCVSRPGDVVVRQGDPSDRFSRDREGTFEVTVTGPTGTSRHVRTASRATPSSGERGLLGGTPRTRTVAASAAGLLFAMDGTDLPDADDAAAGASRSG